MERYTEHGSQSPMLIQQCESGTILTKGRANDLITYLITHSSNKMRTGSGSEAADVRGREIVRRALNV